MYKVILFIIFNFVFQTVAAASDSEVLYTVLNCIRSDDDPSQLSVHKIKGQEPTYYEVVAHKGSEVLKEEMVAFNSSYDGDSRFLQLISFTSKDRFEFLKIGETKHPDAADRHDVQYFSGIILGKPLHRADGMIRISHFKCTSDTDFKFPEYP